MRQICGKYAVNMRQICGKYAANMRQICGKYAANMRQICGKYAPNMRQIYGKYIGQIYAANICRKYMPQILVKVANDSVLKLSSGV